MSIDLARVSADYSQKGYEIDKVLKRDKGKFYLQAENPKFPDLYAVDELQTAGVVKGVIRKY